MNTATVVDLGDYRELAFFVEAVWKDFFEQAGANTEKRQNEMREAPGLAAMVEEIAKAKLEQAKLIKRQEEARKAEEEAKEKLKKEEAAQQALNLAKQMLHKARREVSVLQQATVFTANHSVRKPGESNFSESAIEASYQRELIQRLMSKHRESILSQLWLPEEIYAWTTHQQMTATRGRLLADVKLATKAKTTASEQSASQIQEWVDDRSKVIEAINEILAKIFKITNPSNPAYHADKDTYRNTSAWLESFYPSFFERDWEEATTNTKAQQNAQPEAKVVDSKVEADRQKKADLINKIMKMLVASGIGSEAAKAMAAKVAKKHPFLGNPMKALEMAAVGAAKHHLTTGDESTVASAQAYAKAAGTSYEAVVETALTELEEVKKQGEQESAQKNHGTTTRTAPTTKKDKKPEKK